MAKSENINSDLTSESITTHSAHKNSNQDHDAKSEKNDASSPKNALKVMPREKSNDKISADTKPKQIEMNSSNGLLGESFVK